MGIHKRNQKMDRERERERERERKRKRSSGSFKELSEFNAKRGKESLPTGGVKQKEKANG